MDFNAAKKMVNDSLHDKVSPGKIDKYEALEIKKKLTEEGNLLDQPVEMLLEDHIKSGKVEKGSALTTIQGLCDQHSNEDIKQTVLDE